MDIVERLRADRVGKFGLAADEAEEAADFIERLRAEVAASKAAQDDAYYCGRKDGDAERDRLRELLREAGTAMREVHEGRRHPQLALSIIARIDAALSKEKP